MLQIKPGQHKIECPITSQQDARNILLQLVPYREFVNISHSYLGPKTLELTVKPIGNTSEEVQTANRTALQMHATLTARGYSAEFDPDIGLGHAISYGFREGARYFSRLIRRGA